MAVKTESKTIGGKTISVTQWPATKAIEMQVKLLSALKGYTVDLLELEDDAQIIRMLQIAMSVAGEGFIPMVKEFVLAAAIDGKTITNAGIDIEYSGDLTRMFLTFAFVAQTNYQDFFGIGLGALDK